MTFLHSPLSVTLSALSVLLMVGMLSACGDSDSPIEIDNENSGDANQYNAGDPAVAVCGGGELTVTGTVLGPDGDPLEGARVHVGNYRERYEFDDEFNYRCNGAVSRSDGTFELVNVNATDELVRAVKQIDLGEATFAQYEALLEVDLTAGTEFDFNLQTSVTRRADCGDPDGGSLHGVVYHGDTTTLPTARIVTRQDDTCGTVAGTGGVYELTNMPPGDYNIVYTRGRWRDQETVTIESGNNQELDLHIVVE